LLAWLEVARPITAVDVDPTALRSHQLNKTARIASLEILRPFPSYLSFFLLATAPEDDGAAAARWRPKERRCGATAGPLAGTHSRLWLSALPSSGLVATPLTPRARGEAAWWRGLPRRGSSATSHATSAGATATGEPQVGPCALRPSF
jgi:hypothetical protein